ncbi:hypothetical protein LMG28614_06030 [Paraburkholderia ultramafica]|uniref:Uncharacterized protein n=1 Tax=Paraburkholderia ultramafica TaxID=1544867 RepID=A0A6S7BL94_9BURK|nr:hypothetical protein LMG28614_06030 [Paraburkholderia ultramafica]
MIFNRRGCSFSNFRAEALLRLDISISKFFRNLLA